MLRALVDMLANQRCDGKRNKEQGKGAQGSVGGQVY